VSPVKYVLGLYIPEDGEWEEVMRGSVSEE
jgi:hypothetical protein